MEANTESKVAGASPICYIVTPVGMLGYGLDEDLTAKELARAVSTGIPTALILDSGSTDSGPGRLAFGSMTCPPSAYVKDLTKLLALVYMFHVPLIFSSAGGDGTDEHVGEMCQILEELAADERYHGHRFKIISIFSSIEKAIVSSRLKEGRITGCGPCVPPLSEDDIHSSRRIVGQIGPEPFVDAMEADPDFNVIVAGRAYDPAPYAAYALFQLRRRFLNISPEDNDKRISGFSHMGKILECGGLCSTPKSSGAVSTTYEDGSFVVWPIDPSSRCTPISVAAHALYENTRPDILRGPGGVLHLDQSKYEQLEDGRSVRVSGSNFRPSEQDGAPYQLKLEAARPVGYRTMFLGTVKDSILIQQIDTLLARVKLYVQQQHPEAGGMWQLDFHVYGERNDIANAPAEIFIVAEALAQTQQLATSIASKARIAMIHGSYPGQKATAGNFGFGIGGLTEIELGECAAFCIYHLMELDPGEERLIFSTYEDSKTATTLIRSNVSFVGNGQETLPNNGLKGSIEDLQTQLAGISLRHTDKTETNGQIFQRPATSPDTLSDVSEILRSKNAGPFEITIDILFLTREIYDRIQNCDVLSVENVSQALNIDQRDIIWMGFFEPALAFKVTIPRFRNGKMTSAGSFMEDDVHGSQQHTGISRMKLPKNYFSGRESAL